MRSVRRARVRRRMCTVRGRLHLPGHEWKVVHLKTGGWEEAGLAGTGSTRSVRRNVHTEREGLEPSVEILDERFGVHDDARSQGGREDRDLQVVSLHAREPTGHEGGQIDSLG